MKLSDFQNLDFQNVGDWPLPVKFFFMAVLFIVVLGAAYYFDTNKQIDALENERKIEVAHFSTIEEKQKKAANLEPLKQQMKEMQQAFGDLLKLLPSRTEVAGLLVDISQTGLAAGLEFKLFKPSNEAPSEYYAELPIQISVIGDYHEFGEFISGVAALPRIVTTHDITISSGAARGGGGRKGIPSGTPALTMTATAKTYRALDEQEYAAEAKKASQAARKGKGGQKK